METKTMMDRNELYLAWVLELQKFLIRYADKRDYGWVVEELPRLAARGAVYTVIRNGRIVAASVAAPADTEAWEQSGRKARPFDPNGSTLLCLFAVTLPMYRRKRGLEFLEEMLGKAMRDWPQTTHLAYQKGQRNIGWRVKELPREALKQQQAAEPVSALPEV